jgi:4-amino-4-deoxy-L-arabinose transferase-like glycosyltransferase
VKPVSAPSGVYRGFAYCAERCLDPLIERQANHAQHMRRAALVLLVIVGVIFLVNRQWLRDNALMNSPSFDALVYQNRSYEDYLLIRRDGPTAILKKYSNGTWQVPPLYVLSGTFFYLLFGLDPANFYILPAISLFLLMLGTYGFIHYWTGQAAWACLGAALVLTIPSIVAFGLRVSQTDFTVGAVYTWALYLLLVSRGLRNTWLSVLYGVTAGACVLLKSTITLYFLAQILILLVYVIREPEHRTRRLLHAILVACIVCGISGWFFYYNYQQILAYYSMWHNELNQITRDAAGISSPVDELTFYLWSFKDFHLRGTMMLYLITIITVLIVAIIMSIRARGSLAGRRNLPGLGFACIWFLVPFIILTSYKSKAASVDFPWLAAYFVIPVMLAAVVLRGRATLIGLLIFAPLLVAQSNLQLSSLLIGSRFEDWRERQIISEILQDVDQRGMVRFTVTNAFIHTHLTSENLRFFILNGTFNGWQNRYAVYPLQYQSDVNEYYRVGLSADYIMTKSGGYIPATHPNNRLAPAVNELLAASPDLVLMKVFDLPDGTQLSLYRNEGRSGVSYPDAASDGWIGPRFPLTFFGRPRDRDIRIQGRILLPPTLQFPAEVFLEDERGEVVSNRATVMSAEPTVLQLTVPASSFSSGAVGTKLYLNSNRVFRPSDDSVSTDARHLMMILNSIADARP